MRLAAIFEAVTAFLSLDRSALPSPPRAESAALPTVLLHGMGDACFNPGFHQLTTEVSKHTQSEAFCFGPKGDPIATLATTMDDQLKSFVEFVRSNSNLKNGFNAIALSQGNLILRAYAQEFNDPPMRNWISIHGPLGGVSSIPRCDPNVKHESNFITGLGCEAVDALLGSLVYSDVAQSLLSEANFFRDPFRLKEMEDANTFLARLNRSSRAKNAWKTQTLTMVKAEKDSMIFPRESEFFGGLNENSFESTFEKDSSPWLKSSGFDRVSLAYETTKGDHMQFSLSELFEWMDKRW